MTNSEKLLAEAQAKNAERIKRRSIELFDALDSAIGDEIERGGPIDSPAYWAAIATLIAKTVMVQEEQMKRTGLFDEMTRDVIEAARRVHAEGYNLER